MEQIALRGIPSKKEGRKDGERKEIQERRCELSKHLIAKKLVKPVVFLNALKAIMLEKYF